MNYMHYISTKICASKVSQHMYASIGSSDFFEVAFKYHDCMYVRTCDGCSP